MERRTFDLIDAVCREGLGNDVWGVADGGNTSDLFGSEARAAAIITDLIVFVVFMLLNFLVDFFIVIFICFLSVLSF